MGSGWLREEIEDIEKEVRNWPEWKKATVGDDRSEVREESSLRSNGTNGSHQH